MPEKYRAPLSITFAFVATHNHFVLDRGGKVFKQTAPVIKLRQGSAVEEHLGLLGLLNSSTACFWLKQVCFPKGGDSQGNEGARVRATLWDERYNYNCTPMGQLPVPTVRPIASGRNLDVLGQEMIRLHPAQVLNDLELLMNGIMAGHVSDKIDATSNDGSTESTVAGAVLGRFVGVRSRSVGVLQRMISLQEELDWECYRLYGLTAEDLTLPVDQVPGIHLGERAFEIVLARRMAAGKEKTEWFARHDSTPITEIPSQWPEPYRKLVERRIQVIQDNANIQLIERPEYKRRWKVEPWDEQLVRALREWLLRRLETYFFGGERMVEGASEKPGTENTFAERPTSPRPSPPGAGGEGDVRPASGGSRAPGLDAAAGFRLSDSAGTVPVSAEKTQAFGPDVARGTIRPLPPGEGRGEGMPTHDPVAALRAGWPGGTQPTVVSTQRLADCARIDADFMLVAELYRNRPDFDVAALVAELVGEESVPFLPVQRYKETGLRHRRVWEDVWDLQRREDAVEAEVRERRAEEDRGLRTEGGKLKTEDEEKALMVEIRNRQREVVGEIPVPPKYKSADFKKTSYWRLRGKLDVPKERWVSFPGCERESDPSLPISWAGWDHLQQAQALAAYLEELKTGGASDAQQLLILAGLQQLIPWLIQWHNDVHPDFGMRLGDYFRDHVRDELQRLGKTDADLGGIAYGHYV